MGLVLHFNVVNIAARAAQERVLVARMRGDLSKLRTHFGAALFGGTRELMA